MKRCDEVACRWRGRRDELMKRLALTAGLCARCTQRKRDSVDPPSACGDRESSARSTSRNSGVRFATAATHALSEEVAGGSGGNAGGAGGSTHRPGNHRSGGAVGANGMLPPHRCARGSARCPPRAPSGSSSGRGGVAARTGAGAARPPLWPSSARGSERCPPLAPPAFPLAWPAGASISVLTAA